jgi:hypothetical protein
MLSDILRYIFFLQSPEALITSGLYFFTPFKASIYQRSCSKKHTPELGR